MTDGVCPICGKETDTYLAGFQKCIECLALIKSLRKDGKMVSCLAIIYDRYGG